MAQMNQGRPLTYGTNVSRTGNTVGVVTLLVTDWSTGSEVVVYRGEMLLAELKLSSEADTNQATDYKGEVVSHCTYNQRKSLSFSGVVLANFDSNAVPTSAAETVAQATLAFAAPILPGHRLQLNFGGQEWNEISTDNNEATFISQNNTATHNGGTGNWTITSVEKTRSSTNYAEWSISALEYLNVDHTGDDTTLN